MINYEVEVTFPTGSSNKKAGLIFSHDGNNSYYAVVLERTDTARLAIYKITSGSWGSPLASDDMSISESTPYTLTVVRKQSSIEASVFATGGDLTYDSSTEFGTGQSGLYSDKTGVTFDDFKAHDAAARDAMTPRVSGSTDTSLSSNKLWVQGTTRPGEATVESFSDDDYRVQVEVDPQSNAYGYVWLRYSDANNGYRFMMKHKGSSTVITLHVFENGEATYLDQLTVTPGPLITIYFLANGSTIQAPALDSPRWLTR